jgi:hypothetical protein
MPRKTLNSYFALDIRRLDRLKLSRDQLNEVRLESGEDSGSILIEVLENDSLVLQFNVQGWEEELANPIRQTISISRTAARRGERRWFVCPFCQRDSAKLFSYPYFMCRICVGLPYASQSQAGPMRRLNRAIQQRLKIGGTASLWDPFPLKPKGMHHATYARLKQEDERVIKPYLQAQLQPVVRELEKLSRQFGNVVGKKQHPE